MMVVFANGTRGKLKTSAFRLDGFASPLSLPDSSSDLTLHLRLLADLFGSNLCLQEEELAKFAAALGQSAQAQLAAQADAEARMMLEAARRSGMQVEPPPSFSEFIKQSNGGLASSEAMSAMREQVHLRQAGQEPGSDASWEVGGGEAVEGRGRSGANEERDQDLNQLASQDMTQSAADAVQGADQDANLKAG
jgi:hypothetical protein